MVTITINALRNVNLWDLDNGMMVMHVDDYTHTYNDMAQLATDLLEYAASETTQGWEGNEEETNNDELAESEWVKDIISNNGTLSGQGTAYEDLVRAMVAQMPYDLICMA